VSTTAYLSVIIILNDGNDYQNTQFVEIRCGKFGLGAFATCHISKNAFIGGV